MSVWRLIMVRVAPARKMFLIKLISGRTELAIVDIRPQAEKKAQYCIEITPTGRKGITPTSDPVQQARHKGKHRLPSIGAASNGKLV